MVCRSRSITIPKHAYNVDRMIDATRKSLDYSTTNFSPYQHKQVRILEFPRYPKFAQSFANTIPFSESDRLHCRARPSQDRIDYVFYVTAHEIAHQWWGHQVIGANVQGQTMLSESLAQYSALMVMERSTAASTCAASSSTSWIVICAAAAASPSRSCR